MTLRSLAFIAKSIIYNILAYFKQTCNSNLATTLKGITIYIYIYIYQLGSRWIRMLFLWAKGYLQRVRVNTHKYDIYTEILIILRKLAIVQLASATTCRPWWRVQCPSKEYFPLFLVRARRGFETQLRCYLRFRARFCWWCDEFWCSAGRWGCFWWALPLHISAGDVPWLLEGYNISPSYPHIDWLHAR